MISIWSTTRTRRPSRTASRATARTAASRISRDGTQPVSSTRGRPAQAAVTTGSTPAPAGETTRAMALEAAPGVSAPFLAVNRNKRGLVLDLKRNQGVAILKKLVATADVLIENYRPGVAKRLGVDYPTLAAINPRLIYCSISGYGQTGPYAGRGGYDLIAQGMSGIMIATGSEGGAPVKIGVPITDLGAGLFGVFGILCALRAPHRTGRGQLVDTSLFEAGPGAPAAGAPGARGHRAGPPRARPPPPPTRPHP